MLVAVRLELDDGKISEAEHIVAAVIPNNTARLETPRPGLLREVPVGGRRSYEDIRRDRALVLRRARRQRRHVDAVRRRLSAARERHGHGWAEGRPRPEPTRSRTPVARLCGPQLTSRTFVYIDRIENRRLIAADPVTGLSMGFSHFRHPFTNLPYQVTHADGSTSERNKENMPFNPFDMPAAHIFKVGADGLVHEIEAVGFVAPYASPTGWE